MNRIVTPELPSNKRVSLPPGDDDIEEVEGEAEVEEESEEEEEEEEDEGEEGGML